MRVSSRAVVLGLGLGFVALGGLASGCGADDANRRVSQRDDEDAGEDAGSGGSDGSGGAASGDASASGGADAASGGADASVDASVEAGSGDSGGVQPTSCEGGTTLCVDDQARCVDLSSDTYCGSCTRNCTLIETMCQSGVCGPLELNGNGRAWESAFDGTALFLFQVNSSSVSAYSIVRVPTDGSAQSTFWTQQSGLGQDVAFVEGGSLYWSTVGTPQVLSKSILAAASVIPTVVFSPDLAPRYLKKVGDTLYWVSGMSSDAAYVYSRPFAAPSTDKGSRIVTADQGYVSAFVVAPDALYWVSGTGSTPTLWTVPPSGGTPTAVPGAVVSDSAPLFLVGNTLYFVRSGPNTNVLDGIWRYTPGDAAATQLVSRPSINVLAADASWLYFRSGFNGEALERAPIAGGNTFSPVVPRVGTFYASIVGQDAAYLYTAYDALSNGPALKIAK